MSMLAQTSHVAEVAPAPTFTSTVSIEIWPRLVEDAKNVVVREPTLKNWVDRILIRHDRFEDALAAMLGSKLGNYDVSAIQLIGLVQGLAEQAPGVVEAAAADLEATVSRNPAASTLTTPFLYFKGFAGLQWHRFAHVLWHQQRRELAFFIQSRVSDSLGIDIHPAARFGHGVFIDHGHGVVVGETAVVGNDVSILQGVTLGGTGKTEGDRHPKVGNGVLLGAGAKVLGSISIGDHAKVAASSVVLHDVPACTTVAGVPAKVVRTCCAPNPALSMDHSLDKESGISD
jgi:serine O-acetyltransferase